jgi:hypothetical protein
MKTGLAGCRRHQRLAPGIQLRAVAEQQDLVARPEFFVRAGVNEVLIILPAIILRTGAAGM